MQKKTRKQEHKEHLFYTYGIDVDKLTFLQYLAYYNEEYGHEISDPQLEFAMWVEETKNVKSRLFMGHRYLGKSHMAMRWCEYNWLKDPDWKVIILCSTHESAKETVEALQTSIESFWLLEHLKPSRKTKWTKTAFNVDRDIISKDSSCLASAQRKNIVGKHADMLLLDDFEVGNNTDSEEKRIALRKAMVKLFPISLGRVFYIGTPHTEDSLYWERMKPQYKTSVLMIPIMDEDGNPANPDVAIGGVYYNKEWIEETRAELPVGEWESQFMLKNTKFGETKIKHELVNAFEGQINRVMHEDWLTQKKTYTYELTVNDNKPVPVIHMAAYWDWATGREGNDASVVAVVASDPNRNVYVLELKTLSPVEKGQTFRKQCEEALALCIKYGIGTLYAETTGHITLEAELHQTAAELYNGRSINIQTESVEHKGNQHKSDSGKVKRIETYVEPTVRVGRLYVHHSLWGKDDNKPLRGQMIDFPKSKHDDHLDALAGAIEYLEHKAIVVEQGAIADKPFGRQRGGVRTITRRGNG